MLRSDFMLMAASAAAAPRLSAPAGRTFLPTFASAPYPHRGRPYRDSTVGIYVPPHFRPGDRTDYAVHFHGWRNDVRHVLERYRLREQIDLSKRNAVLIVPQGPKDAPDSDFGKLEHDPNAFARLIADAGAFLRERHITSAQSAGHIVLSSHSGGYGGAGGVLTRGGMNDSITDVLLFDSAYGYYDAFANWVKANADHHLLSLFTADTCNGNAALMGMVQAPQPNIFVHLAHGMTLAELQTRAPTFITTDVAHDELDAALQLVQPLSPSDGTYGVAVIISCASRRGERCVRMRRVRRAQAQA